MENWKKEKVTEVQLKRFNAPTFTGDKYIIGTVRYVGHYYLLYSITGIDKLVRKL